MMKWIFLVLVLNCSFFEMALAQSKLTNVWVFNVFQQSITRNKVEHYFDYLTKQTGIPLSLTIDHDFTVLYERCITGEPKVIIAAANITQIINEKCGYKPIAKTYQRIQLFARKGSQVTTPQTVKRVGVVRGTVAAQIAETELNFTNEKFTLISFPTLFDLIKNIDRENLDSIVFADVLFTVTSSLERKWQPVYLFPQQGSAEIIVSPTLDRGTVEKLQYQLLLGDAFTRSVWQESVGLGEFFNPTKPEDDQLP